MEKRLDGAVELFVAFAVFVNVANVVDDVVVQGFAQDFIGNDGHELEEELEKTKGGHGALVSHENEGGDAGFADVAVELECGKGEGL